MFKFSDDILVWERARLVVCSTRYLLTEKKFKTQISMFSFSKTFLGTELRRSRIESGIANGFQ